MQNVAQFRSADYVLDLSNNKVRGYTLVTFYFVPVRIMFVILPSVPWQREGKVVK